MTEYINKAELYEKIAELEEHTRNTLTQLSRDNPLAPKYRVQLLELGRFKHFVADFPTTEASPVVHGRWDECIEKHPFGKKWMECSNCKSINKSMIKFNYCPNCGAMMTEIER